MRIACQNCGAVNQIDLNNERSDYPCGGCQQLFQKPKSLFTKGVFFGEFQVIEILKKRSVVTEVLAMQPALKRRVVLKILTSEAVENKELVKQFVELARKTAALPSPYISKPLSISQDNGLYFYPIEYVGRHTIESMLENYDQQDWPMFMPMIADIATALKVAWNEKRFLHGNLKPSNIQIDKYGFVQLKDFGIADLSLESDDNKLNGTPHFLSPEKILGEPIDFTSDLYCLGVTMFLCLTGQYPLDSEEPSVILQKHLDIKPKRVEILNPLVPSCYGDLVASMLEKKPADRPASVEEFLERLQLCMETPINQPDEVIQAIPIAQAQSAEVDTIEEYEILEPSSELQPGPTPVAIAVNKATEEVQEAPSEDIGEQSEASIPPPPPAPPLKNKPTKSSVSATKALRSSKKGLRTKTRAFKMKTKRPGTAEN